MYSRRRVFAAACLGMLVFGIVLTTLGALLPSLIERYGIDKAYAGSLFLTMTFGILVATLVFGPTADRWGYQALLIVGELLILLGLETLAFAPSASWLRGGVLLVGVGGGFVNGGTNALAADVSEGGRGAGLSLLGIFFGIGAVGVPFTLGVLLGRFSYAAITAAVGAAVLVPIVYTAAIRFPPPKHAQGIPLAEAARLVRQPALLMFGLLLFFQSGMEITVGGWSATFAREVLGLAANPGLLFLSLYWFGMMLARLVLSGALRRVPPAHALLASIALSLAGSFLLVGARGVAAASVGIFVLGAGFAAVFPVVLGFVGDRYASLSATAFGIAISMALVGGMTLPYLTGLLGDRHGLRASFLVIPASLVAQAIVFGLVRRARRA